MGDLQGALLRFSDLLQLVGLWVKDVDLLWQQVDPELLPPIQDLGFVDPLVLFPSCLLRLEGFSFPDLLFAKQAGVDRSYFACIGRRPRLWSDEGALDVSIT